MKLDISIVFELLFIVAVVLGLLLLALTFIGDDAALLACIVFWWTLPVVASLLGRRGEDSRHDSPETIRSQKD